MNQCGICRWHLQELFVFRERQQHLGKWPEHSLKRGNILALSQATNRLFQELLVNRQLPMGVLAATLKANLDVSKQACHNAPENCTGVACAPSPGTKHIAAASACP